MFNQGRQKSSEPMAQLQDESDQNMMYYGANGNQQQDELSDEEECGDTDEHIIHSVANFNPSGMMSSSATSSGAVGGAFGAGSEPSSMQSSQMQQQMSYSHSQSSQKMSGMTSTTTVTTTTYTGVNGAAGTSSSSSQQFHQQYSVAGGGQSSGYQVNNQQQLKNQQQLHMQNHQMQMLDEIDENEEATGAEDDQDGERLYSQNYGAPVSYAQQQNYNKRTGQKQLQQMAQQHQIPSDMRMKNPNQQLAQQDSQHQAATHNWNTNQMDVIADEADEDNSYSGAADHQNVSGGAVTGAGGGQDFDKAYKNLVQQMLYQGQSTGANVLVPTEDYTLALNEDRKVDLSRIQEDLERRRARQEAREREARAQREAKELEGCTFAPQLMTKKKKRHMPATPNVGTGTNMMFSNINGGQQHQQLPGGYTQGQPGVVDGVVVNQEMMAAMEGRDLDKFLLDQKRYEEERKQKKAKIIMAQEENERQMKATKMNANSRRILERKLKTAANAANAGAGDGEQPTDGGSIVAGQLVNGQEQPRHRSNIDRVHAARNNGRAAKKVPTQSLDLSFSSNRRQNAGGGATNGINNTNSFANSNNQAGAGSSFAPKINKRSIQIAQAKREGRIEDHLIKQGELQKKKKADMETKKARDSHTQLTKITDKYVLQKFVKEFERVLAFIYAPAELNQQDTQDTQDTQNNNNSLKSEVGRIKEALSAPMNYLRFKEFLIEMCFMTEAQATSDSSENTLAFELWELIAPRVNRELPPEVDDEDDSAMEKLDQAYITEMQAQQIAPADLKTIIMAILKINDGKHFFSASEAPIPQSEGEIGFRRPAGASGVFYLRYEEIPQLQKTFDLFYTNRQHLQGIRIEAQKQLKQDIETQKQIEQAKPVLSSKTDEFAAKYRMKQMTKNSNLHKNSIKDDGRGAINDANGNAIVDGQNYGGEIDTFQWLSKQQTKTTSSWKDEAKRAQEERELRECTFAPQITVRKAANPTVANSNNEPQGPANERLYKMRKNQRDKTEKTKEQYEYEKQAQECTFAPNISHKPASSKKTQAANTASERQQRTMQKQLERMNKAREEKERIKKMTERGIPKSNRQNIPPSQSAADTNQHSMMMQQTPNPTSSSKHFGLEQHSASTTAMHQNDQQRQSANSLSFFAKQGITSNPIRTAQMAQVMQRGSSQPRLNTSSGSILGAAAQTSIGSGIANVATSQSTTALNKSKRFGMNQQSTVTTTKQTTTYYQMSGGEAHKTGSTTMTSASMMRQSKSQQKSHFQRAGGNHSLHNNTRHNNPHHNAAAAIGNDGTSSPYLEPVNLETRPLQQMASEEEEEEEQKQQQQQENTPEVIRQQEASYEEEDSNAVTQELPSTVIVQDVVQKPQTHQQSNQAANGAFQVQTSGDEVALSNVASTMFAQRHTQSILSDDTTQEQQAHMAGGMQNQQQNSQQNHLVNEAYAVTDHNRYNNQRAVVGGGDSQDGLQEDEFQLVTVDTVMTTKIGAEQDMKIHHDETEFQHMNEEEYRQQQQDYQYQQQQQYMQQNENYQVATGANEEQKNHGELPEALNVDGDVPEGSQLPQLLDAEQEAELNADEINNQQQVDEDDGQQQELRQEEDGGAIYGAEDDEEDDFDDSNPPLLFVDVNLGQNEQQRIVVYEGDTATDLAEKFCQEHDLDEETQKNLEALLEQQIASVLTKIDENEEDAESYETSN